MGLKCHSYQDFVKLGSKLSQTNTAAVGSLPEWEILGSVLASKHTEGTSLSYTGFPVLQLHCPERKMRMFKGKQKVELYSALYACGSNSGKLCFRLPAHYYCCLPISLVIIYSYTNEIWMIVIRKPWTASINIVNIDFPLWKITFIGVWELDGPVMTSLTKTQEIYYRYSSPPCAEVSRNLLCFQHPTLCFENTLVGIFRERNEGCTVSEVRELLLYSFE